MSATTQYLPGGEEGHGLVPVVVGSSVVGSTVVGSTVVGSTVVGSTVVVSPVIDA